MTVEERKNNLLNYHPKGSDDHNYGAWLAAQTLEILIEEVFFLKKQLKELQDGN